MTRFERLSVGTSVILGLAGCILGTASWYQSYQALQVAKATSRPYVEAVAVTLDSPPSEASAVEFELELKNFGQASALNVSFVCLRTDGTPTPPTETIPILYQLSPGSSNSINISGETYKANEQIRLVGILGYIDSITNERVEQLICFAEIGEMYDVDKKELVKFNKCDFVTREKFRDRGFRISN